MERQGARMKEMLTAWKGISGQENTAKSWSRQFSQLRLLAALVVAGDLTHNDCSPATWCMQQLSWC